MYNSEKIARRDCYFQVNYEKVDLVGEQVQVNRKKLVVVV
jgi:hypothetical protein